MLQTLLGLTVTDTTIIHDYIQIGFGRDVGITIYNNWRIQPETAALQDLVGSRVIEAVSEALAIVLTLDNGTTLMVDLAYDAWHGPEALILYRAGLPTVVWN